MSDKVENVTITVDGVQIVVPKGTNLIDAVSKAGKEIPHYCYHSHLSVAGNCRMCQVEVEGMPKLTIACNTVATEGMVVRTQETSEKAAEAQRAILEFLLINHPLDCTVCDEAGHCKLQDYYYQYNGKPSRFTEEKVHHVKAEPLGREVIYDGERCIVCTRCVRFCNEVTNSSELAVFHRGDKSEIGIFEGKELNNALSGTVVDLCPVGALTHRRWRFNTRIWYTKETDTICAGCSTGCNARVAERDGKIVFVKARLNSEVNKEWMCDEGRYGFERFQSGGRLQQPLIRGDDGGLCSVDLESALASLKKLKESKAEGGENTAVFLSPLLTLEEMWLAREFAGRVLGVQAESGGIALQLRKRSLTEEEAILVSPDYAPNARGAEVLGIGRSGGGEEADWRALLEQRYDELLEFVRSGGAKYVLLVGDRAVPGRDADERFRTGLRNAQISAALATEAPDANDGVESCCEVLLPGRTVNEKSGVMVNRDMRLQRLQAVLQAPLGTLPEWLLLQKVGEVCQEALVSDSVSDERSLFVEMCAKNDMLNGLSLFKLGELGVSLVNRPEEERVTDAVEEARV